MRGAETSYLSSTGCGFDRFRTIEIYRNRWFRSFLYPSNWIDMTGQAECNLGQLLIMRTSLLKIAEYIGRLHAFSCPATTLHALEHFQYPRALLITESLASCPSSAFDPLCRTRLAVFGRLLPIATVRSGSLPLIAFASRYHPSRKIPPPHITPGVASIAPCM